MIVFIGFIIAMLLFILIGTAIAIHNFDRNVTRLFSLSETIEGEVQFQEGQTNLPEPVRRYFITALDDPQSFVSYVRLTHYGKFRTTLHGQWSDITGEEYFTVAKPGFIWKGKTGMLTAVDSFINGQGSLKIYLLPFLRIAKKSGRRINQGQLLRWLGECVWFPTALLPGDMIHWEAIDAAHAKLILNYGKRELYYFVTFNEAYQITTLETKRYMDGKKLETWIGRLSGYEMRQGTMIPTTMEAIWKVRGKEYPYAIFHLDRIEYNKPEKFK